VQEAERSGLIGRKAHPVGPGRFQQRVCSKNIGADESVRPGDRAIDMALGSQVHHRIGGMLCKHLFHTAAVADVGLNESIARPLADGFERVQVGGIGQLVDVDNLRVGFAHQMAANGRSNETGSARYKDLSHAAPRFYQTCNSTRRTHIYIDSGQCRPSQIHSISALATQGAGVSYNQHRK
jgi:hypothetical protein